MPCATHCEREVPRGSQCLPFETTPARQFQVTLPFPQIAPLLRLP